MIVLKSNHSNNNSGRCSICKNQGQLCDTCHCLYYIQCINKTCETIQESYNILQDIKSILPEEHKVEPESFTINEGILCAVIWNPKDGYITIKCKGIDIAIYSNIYQYALKHQNTKYESTHQLWDEPIIC